MDKMILGVDGGGSQTTALIAGASGVIGRGRAGSSNYHAVGKEQALQALKEAVTTALEQAGIAALSLSAAVLGLAGAGRSIDRPIFEAWAAAFLPAVPLKITTDAEIVLELCLGYPRLAAISGTGAAVFGQTGPGQPLQRASGWGYLLGDEGSAFWIGRAALQAVMRATDGRGDKTSLTALALDHYQVPTPERLVNAVYAGDFVREQVAAFSQEVDSAARTGDPLATRIIEQAGEELAMAVKAVCDRMVGTKKAACVLAGGVLLGSDIARQALLREVEYRGITLQPLFLASEPALGALLLAEKLVANQANMQ